MSPAHVVVTWDTDAIPLALVISGVLVITGATLALARRYPLAAWTGMALEVAGWSLGFAQEWRSGDWPFTAASGVMAAWSTWRLWSQRETVR